MVACGAEGAITTRGVAGFAASKALSFRNSERILSLCVVQIPWDIGKWRRNPSSSSSGYVVSSRNADNPSRSHQAHMMIMLTSPILYEDEFGLPSSWVEYMRQRRRVALLKSLVSRKANTEGSIRYPQVA